MVARGGAYNVECLPFGVALGWGGVSGSQWWGGWWDVSVAGRAVGIKVGVLKEERWTCFAAAGQTSRRKGVGRKGGE